MENLKRKALPDTSSSKKMRQLETCPHNINCYRKNPHHFKEFDHPHLEQFIDQGDKLDIPDAFPQPKQMYIDQIAIFKPILATRRKESNASEVQKEEKTSTTEAGPSKPKECLTSAAIEQKTGIKPLSSIQTIAYTGSMKGTMLEKLERTAPYNVFFTTIPKAPETLKQFNSATFTDILCPSLGELVDSLQINFMIDISWLLEQYKARNVHTQPLTILYGDEFPDMDTFMNRFCPNITYKFVKMNDPFGCHHSKVGIYVYKDKSIRIVVSTANLYYEDWNHYNQGFWMSPKLPQMPSTSKDTDGESVTGFKKLLINYLKDYKFKILDKWIDYVKRADCSQIKVFLTTSTPGKHYPDSDGCHLQQVGRLLSEHCVLPEKQGPQSEGPLSWGVFAQSSSIGSMGPNAASWLRGCILRSLASHTKSPLPNSSYATLNIIYPSVDNVMTGLFGAESGGCLPYSKATNEKQRWLQEYLHQWKADGLGRTRAMPHIKTYTRISPCLTKLAYFLLTSANLSKSAWGGNLSKDCSVHIRSYEVGVMFLPKFFDEEYLYIRNTPDMKNKNVFPLMYDLPLKSYDKSDYPWCN